MPDEENNKDDGVQATNGSTAVGNINVGGSVGGDIIIGGTHIYNQSQPSESTDFVKEIIETSLFEPETILVTAGSFWMENTPQTGPGNGSSKSEILLPLYRIGKYPVTNAQYEEFIRDAERPVPSALGWEGRKVPDGLEEQPVMGVTWYDALEYCKWLSKKTDRNYSLPNAAQLDRGYQIGNEIEDVADIIYQWTCTLWGEKQGSPDAKYRFPWKDDRRNDLTANSQIRRMICVYTKVEGLFKVTKRIGQFPDDVGLPGARHSFRVVMNR